MLNVNIIAFIEQNIEGLKWCSTFLLLSVNPVKSIFSCYSITIYHWDKLLHVHSLPWTLALFTLSILYTQSQPVVSPWPSDMVVLSHPSAESTLKAPGGGLKCTFNTCASVWDNHNNCTRQLNLESNKVPRSGGQGQVVGLCSFPSPVKPNVTVLW